MDRRQPMPPMGANKAKQVSSGIGYRQLWVGAKI